jgi:hypothetical protein
LQQQERKSGPGSVSAARQSGAPEPTAIPAAQAFTAAPVVPSPAPVPSDGDTGPFSWQHELETINDEETLVDEDEGVETPLPHPVAEDQETPLMDSEPLPDEVAAIFAMRGQRSSLPLLSMMSKAYWAMGECDS